MAAAKTANERKADERARMRAARAARDERMAALPHSDPLQQ